MDLAILKAADQRIRNGSLYKKWAQANPGESTKYVNYVNAILAGQSPAMPTLATETGIGLVTYASGYIARPVLAVKMAGTAQVGQKLTATISG